jgi:hypothetical protein
MNRIGSEIRRSAQYTFHVACVHFAQCATLLAAGLRCSLHFRLQHENPAYIDHRHFYWLLELIRYLLVQRRRVDAEYKYAFALWKQTWNVCHPRAIKRTINRNPVCLVLACAYLVRLIFVRGAAKLVASTAAPRFASASS